MTVFVGIDPGESGALAFVDVDDCTVALYDMPIKRSKKSGQKSKAARTRQEVDIYRLAAMFRSHDPAKTFLEEVWTSPQMGIVSAGSFMGNKYSIIAVSETLGIPVTQFRPRVWQSFMRCPASDKGSVERAEELFPLIKNKFRGPRGGLLSGPGEALMIGLYGILNYSEHRLKKPLELINDQKDVM